MRAMTCSLLYGILIYTVLLDTVYAARLRCQDFVAITAQVCILNGLRIWSSSCQCSNWTQFSSDNLSTRMSFRLSRMLSILSIWETLFAPTSGSEFLLVQ